METPIRKGMSPLLTWLDTFSQSSDNNKVYNTLFWIGLSKLVEIDSTVRPYPEKENPSLLSLFCWTVTQLWKLLTEDFSRRSPNDSWISMLIVMPGPPISNVYHKVNTCENCLTAKRESWYSRTPIVASQS